MNIREINPPENLEAKILKRISKSEKRAFILRFSGRIALALSSFVGIIASVIYLVQEASRTGFYSYLSLAFSDSTIIASYLKEFTMSLAESMPIFGFIIFLALVAMFIWSVSKLPRFAKLRLAFN